MDRFHPGVAFDTERPDPHQYLDVQRDSREDEFDGKTPDNNAPGIVNMIGVSIVRFSRIQAPFRIPAARS